jgi:exonuclease VII large subunit
VATLLPGETVIRNATEVSAGAAIRVRVAQGRMDCEVTKVSGEQ